MSADNNNNKNTGTRDDDSPSKNLSETSMHTVTFCDFP